MLDLKLLKCLISEINQVFELYEKISILQHERGYAHLLYLRSVYYLIWPKLLIVRSEVLAKAQILCFIQTFFVAWWISASGPNPE